MGENIISDKLSGKQQIIGNYQIKGYNILIKNILFKIKIHKICYQMLIFTTNH